MATQPTYYNDGTWTTGFQVGANLVRYPFVNNPTPDAYSRTTQLSYRILPANYVPAMATRTSYTNLILQSETLTTTWTTTNLTVTGSGRANPLNGQVTMFKGLETVTNAQHYLTQNYTFTAASYTFAIFVAGGLGRDYQYLRINDGTSDHACFFNTTTGTVGTASGGAVGVMYAQSDGSYLLAITATCAAGSGAVYVQSASNSSTVSYAGDVTKGFYAWGASLFLGAIGPYITTTTTSKTISSPDFQVSVDPFAYLAWESDMTIDTIQRASFSRLYSRIPTQQVKYNSALIVRPVMHDIVSGSSYAVTFDDGVTSWVFNSRKTVSVVGDLQGGTQVAVAGQSFGTLPGTTFTIVDSGGASASPNLNTSAASMQSSLAGALTALTSISVTTVPGSLTVSWVGLVKSVGTTDTTVTMTGGAGQDGSVTFVASAPTVTDVQGQAVPYRILTSTAHGASAGYLVALWNGNKLVGTTRVIAVTTDTFTIPCENGPLTASNVVITNCGFAPQAAARYVNGPIEVTTKEVQDFYLPGVTPGITTPADIPLITPKLDPVSWLGEIVAGSTYAATEGSKLDQWDNTIIYVQTNVSCQMSDALDTVSVSA